MVAALAWLMGHIPFAGTSSMGAYTVTEAFQSPAASQSGLGAFLHFFFFFFVKKKFWVLLGAANQLQSTELSSPPPTFHPLSW